MSDVGLLNDRLINAGQEILKRYHSVSGLQDVTLGYTLAFEIQRSEFVQLIHNGHNHWITVSNIGAEPHTVFVYDSSRHQCVNSDVKNQIAALVFSSEKEITLQYVAVQQQLGSYDCGLFALAFATSLVHGCDPAKTTFTQVRMRQHLYQCINRGILSLFPSASSVRDDCGILSTETIELYCKCRMPEIPPMVECSTCGEWFHTECVNVPDDALDDTDIPWFCCACDGACS